jgi:superfamily II DNA helicase RecQ
MDVVKLYGQVCETYKFKHVLKTLQIQVIDAILRNTHVCAILPTGYGKSLCFVLPPLILDVVEPGKKHIAIIISPLKALMRSQKSHFESLGIRAACVTSKDDLEGLHGKYTSLLVFVFSMYLCICAINILLRILISIR